MPDQQCRRLKAHKQLRQAREQKLQAQAQAAQEAAAKGAEIDAREDLTRNEKMVAKLAAGMTLQAIGEQHGISRERVRQIKLSSKGIQTHIRLRS